MTEQRGINRVIVAVWDIEASRQVFEDVLGAQFEPKRGATEAPEYGIRVAIAFDAGIELVSPIDGVDSYMRTELERNGEGIKGVVFAVADADAAAAAANEHGMRTYASLDYTPEQIDAQLGGRFDRYKEHFIAARVPLSGTVLLGEFIERARG